VAENSVGKMAFSGVAWPRDAKPASPGARGSALRSKPGLNFPFAGHLVSVLMVTLQIGIPDKMFSLLPFIVTLTVPRCRHQTMHP